MTHEISEDDFKFPQFSHYRWNLHCMMEKMGYEIIPKGLAWTSAKEDEHYFDLSYQKWKPLTIIIRLEGD